MERSSKGLQPTQGSPKHRRKRKLRDLYARLQDAESIEPDLISEVARGCALLFDLSPGH
jgi:hypothetical protein